MENQRPSIRSALNEVRTSLSAARK